MTEAKNEVVNEEIVNSEHVITFKKPYSFEGKEYKEVDLSGLENLSTDDLIAADKQFSASGQAAMMNETNLSYCMIVASKAAGIPVEFFNRLPAREGIRVKNKVVVFLNG